MRGRQTAGLALHRFVTACASIGTTVWAYTPILGPHPTSYPVNEAFDDLAALLGETLRLYAARQFVDNPSSVVVLVPPTEGTVRWAEILAGGDDRGIHVLQIEGAS